MFAEVAVVVVVVVAVLPWSVRHANKDRLEYVEWLHLTVAVFPEVVVAVMAVAIVVPVRTQ